VAGWSVARLPFSPINFCESDAVLVAFVSLEIRIVVCCQVDSPTLDISEVLLQVSSSVGEVRRSGLCDRIFHFRCFLCIRGFLFFSVSHTRVRVGIEDGWVVAVGLDRKLW
jgi:hypothetical protein